MDIIINKFRKSVVCIGLLFTPLFTAAQNIVETSTFTLSGTYTWTVPACITSVEVEAWGAGGGGGGGHGTYGSGAGGGGGGAYAKSAFTVIPGDVYTITVGSGGAGGSKSDGISSNGLAGGYSGISFNGVELVRAAGGSGGYGGNQGKSGGLGGQLLSSFGSIMVLSGGNGAPGAAMSRNASGTPQGVPPYIAYEYVGGGGGSSAGRNSAGRNGKVGGPVSTYQQGIPGGAAPAGGANGGKGGCYGDFDIDATEGDAGGGGGGGASQSYGGSVGARGGDGKISINYSKYRIYNSSSSFTVPSGVTFLDVECWGAGGGGGGNSDICCGDGNYGAAGGGGGAYSRSAISVVPGNTYSITVGAGGSGGISTLGANGGSSSFFDTNGLYVYAEGGYGGNSISPGPTTGGAGGSASAGIGQVRYSGGMGGGILAGYEWGKGGGGGSSAGRFADGNNGVDANSNSIGASPGAGAGYGGAAPLGGSRGADGGIHYSFAWDASDFGGGGGGASEPTIGGNGADGQVIIGFNETVEITNTHTLIPNENICSEVLDLPIHCTKVRGHNELVPGCRPIVLTGFSFSVSGSFTSTVISNYKLYVTATPSFTTTALLSVLNNPSGVGLKSFPQFTYTLSTNTAYLWVTADIPSIEGVALQTIMVAETDTVNIVLQNPDHQKRKPIISGSTSGLKTLYSSPVLSSTLTPPAICSGTTFTYTPASSNTSPSFTWTLLPTAHISASTTTGSGSISQLITNTSANPLYATFSYVINSNGCFNNGQNVVVLINPTPLLSSTLTPIAICSGDIFSYTALSATSGAGFAWNRTSIAGITSSGSMSGTGNISQQLNNTTPNPIDVVYTYTTTANSCSGSSENVTVRVNPLPVLSSTLNPEPVCSGSVFTYTPSSITAGSSFAWSRIALPEIAEPSNSGSSGINEVLTNTSTHTISVTYTYTTTANGCSNTENVFLRVNPIPLLNSTLTPSAICSGTTFNYTVTSETAGSSFSWERASTVGINSPSASSGAGNIFQVLNNTTAHPIDVVYTYTATANNCSNTGETIMLTVNPIPVLTSTLNPSGICTNTTFTYTPASSTSNTTFFWSRVAVAGITPAMSSGVGSVNEIVVNGTASVVNTVYSYTATANGCSNMGQHVVVPVYPDAHMALTSAVGTDNQFVCLDDNITNIQYTFNSVVSSVTVEGLPAGIFASYSGNTVMLQDNPDVEGVFVYTIITAGTCAQTSVTGTLTVGISLRPGYSNDTQWVCRNSSIAEIQYAVGSSGANIAWFPSAPSGITSNYAGGIFSISGIPIADGTYTYTVETSGACTTPTSKTGMIVVGIGQPVLSSPLSQVVCNSSALSPIIIDFVGTTPDIAWNGSNGSVVPSGITSGTSTATTYTIGGTPMDDGTYTYTVSTNGCTPQSQVTGTITVGLGQPINSGDLSQIVCNSSSLENININFAGTTPDIIWNGPNGVVAPNGVTSGTATVNTYTIGGTPTDDGTYTYTVISNGCIPQSVLTGTITAGIGQPSNSAPLSQIVCNNTVLSPIVINFAGAAPSISWQSLNGVQAPNGVTTGTATATTYTIGGIPTQDGTYTYTVTLGACFPVSTLSGTITVGLGQPINSGALSQIVCNNNALSAITIDYAGTAPSIVWNALNGSVPPSGVTSGTVTVTTYTIGGTPIQDGTYTYTVSTNGCTTQSQLTGTIIVGIGQPMDSGALSQIVCSNTSLDLITIDFAGNTPPDIHWQGATGTAPPNGLSSGMATATTFTLGGTSSQDGTFTYTVLTTGCAPQSYLTGTITIGLGHPLTSAPLSQQVCEHENTSLITINFAGTDPGIQWQGPNGAMAPNGIISGTATATTYTIGGGSSQNGTYSYTVSSNGCNTNPIITGTITIGIGQPMQSGALSQIVCSNTSLDLITIDFAGNTPPSIHWQGATGITPPPGLSSGMATATTFTIGGTSSQDGTFTYTVLTTGCTPQSHLTGTITIGIGQPLTSAPLSQQVCEHENISLITIDFAGTSPSIQWQGPNGALTPNGITSGTATVTTYTLGGSSSQNGTYTYTVSSNGCNTNPIITGTITIGIGQPMQSGALSQMVCSNTSLDLITIDFAGNTPPSIHWQGATGITPPPGLSSGMATATTFTIGGTSSQDGTYTYTVLTTGCTPQSNLTGTITIGIGQPLNSASLNQDVCKNDTLDLIIIDVIGATSSPTVYWNSVELGTSPPVGISNGMATATTFTLGGTPTSKGSYSYTIVPAGCSGGSALSGLIRVEELNIVLTSAVGTNNQRLCANDAMSLLSYSLTSYWGIPTPTISGIPSGVSGNYNATTKGLSITGSYSSGEYMGIITATGACNTSTENFNLKIITPVASFSAEYDKENPAPKLNVNFVNSSTGADTYLWDFGDGNETSTASPTNVYQEEGIYTILLKSSIASSNSVCWDTAIKIIAVYELIIPNVFTPNGDNVNDIFQIKSIGIDQFEGEIFDRWGARVYEWSLQEQGWDGVSIITDRACLEGTYFYVVKVKSITNNTITRKGTLLLSR